MKRFQCSMGVMIILVLLGCMLLLGGCAPTQSMENPSESTRVVTDMRGVSVKVPTHPQRILTLSSAYDTILLEMVDPSRFVAISSLVKAPHYSFSYKEARQVKQVVRSYSLDGIVSMHPDLVIVPDYMSADVVDSLTSMNIPVFVASLPVTVDDTKKMIAALGVAVNEEGKAKEQIETIDKDVAALATMTRRIPDAEKQSVLFESSMEGYAGAGSIWDNMCTYMHVWNAPTHAGYPERTAFTEERILAMDPDYFFIPTYRHTERAWVDSFLKNPAFQSMKCIKEHHMLPVPAAYLYTGNQYIGKSMLAIASFIYPSYVTPIVQERVKGYEIHVDNVK